MKESELIIMRNKIESLSRVTEFLFNELNHIKTLSSGTFQTIKEMEGYDDAVKKLTERLKEQMNQEQDEKQVLNGDN